MAKFLDTTGVSYHLQQLINQSQDTLILISPYLKVNERLRQSLDDKDRMKIDIRVVYGKNELQPDQTKWLMELRSVRTSFCENLHAKCYLNESEAIVTSMNLYEFSQVNNQEMGIHITKAQDPQLYEEVYNEVRRLIRISDEVRLSVEKVVEQEKKIVKTTDSEKKQIEKKMEPKPTTPVVTNSIAVASGSEKGFCIRCKKDLAFNPQAPYCPDCYKSWKKYENPTYQEKFCHGCGKEIPSMMNKPVCYDCFRHNKSKFAEKK